MDVSVRATSGTDTDGEIVWSWSPDAGIKSRGWWFRKATVARKARSPGRARINR